MAGICWCCWFNTLLIPAKSFSDLFPFRQTERTERSWILKFSYTQPAILVPQEKSLFPAQNLLGFCYFFFSFFCTSKDLLPLKSHITNLSHYNSSKNFRIESSSRQGFSTNIFLSFLWKICLKTALGRTSSMHLPHVIANFFNTLRSSPL